MDRLQFYCPQFYWFCHFYTDSHYYGGWPELHEMERLRHPETKIYRAGQLSPSILRQPFSGSAD